MRRLLWIVAGTGVALWSLLAWGLYGFVDLLGGAVVQQADLAGGGSGLMAGLAWFLAAIRSLGLAAIVFVWGFVSLLILAVPTALSLVLGKAMRPVGPMDWQTMSYPRPGYRDVTPADEPSSPEDEPRLIERR